MNEKELKKRLAEVPDFYEDFVNGLPSWLRHYPEVKPKLEKFLSENPDATTSDILDFVSDAAGL